MAQLQTLAQMRLAAQRLADLENASARFPTSEWNTYVNAGLAWVYKEMLVIMDRPFFVSETNIQVVLSPPLGQVSTFPLPLDYMQLLGVSWASSQNGPWRNLEAYEEKERAPLLSAGSYGGCNVGYMYGFAATPGALTTGTIPTSNSLEIVPQPSLGSWVKVRYVPTCPVLVNDVDTFDAILGFSDAAVTWAAILARRKDDLDTTELKSDMVAHIERIRAIARRRDRSAPPRTQIVRGWGSGLRLGRRRRGVF